MSVLDNRPGVKETFVTVCLTTSHLAKRFLPLLDNRLQDKDPCQCLTSGTEASVCWITDLQAEISVTV